MIRRCSWRDTVIFLAFFALNFSCDQPGEHRTPSREHRVEVTPIRVEHGWGYDILLDGKIYIHQYCIPAIPGQEPFSSSEDALNTGRVVAGKMAKGLIPSVSKHELDSLHIAY